MKLIACIFEWKINCKILLLILKINYKIPPTVSNLISVDKPLQLVKDI